MTILPLYAHRLGRDYGPDSSATALAGALAAGADGLETDVCLSADGELLLLHDPLLAVGTTLDGWAHETSAARIRRGYLRDRFGRPTDERPLTLDELLDAAPAELPVQVDVKAHADPKLAGRTAQAVCERYRRRPERHRLELLSFHSVACATAAARGFAARLVIQADYAPEALAAWSASHGLAGVSVEHFLLTPRLAQPLRLAGLSINTGTVNDAGCSRASSSTLTPSAPTGPASSATPPRPRPPRQPPRRPPQPAPEAARRLGPPPSSAASPLAPPSGRATRHSRGGSPARASRLLHLPSDRSDPLTPGGPSALRSRLFFTPRVAALV